MLNPFYITKEDQNTSIELCSVYDESFTAATFRKVADQTAVLALIHEQDEAAVESGHTLHQLRKQLILISKEKSEILHKIKAIFDDSTSIYNRAYTSALTLNFFKKARFVPVNGLCEELNPLFSWNRGNKEADEEHLLIFYQTIQELTSLLEEIRLSGRNRTVCFVQMDGARMLSIGPVYELTSNNLLSFSYILPEQRSRIQIKSMQSIEPVNQYFAEEYLKACVDISTDYLTYESCLLERRLFIEGDSVCLSRLIPQDYSLKVGEYV
ncbi:hypothetical protein [Paenibacillus sp. MMS20-IR301]|uniref:hypothetical protein n=1 Tax=Paenibacillus sp. MMS20-IR301 TaxID=2895946 RepID=UPI0028EE8025|nr:hypothetical protein [Paenibacillus sp. MMS20-IR301]WNS43484.1 hypothetical protein LOS79_31870 [Paenibacillus sp. MMS20-IR301]